MKLAGKVVLMTGAARRLGDAMARTLAERGAFLAVHYHRSRAEAQELCFRINQIHPGQAGFFRADLRDLRQIHSLVQGVRQRFGRIDVLINNASVYQKTEFGKTSLKNWEDHLNANVRAPFFLCQEVAGLMKKNGEGLIINIADCSALRPDKNFIPYCVSKAGLLCLNSALAKALAPQIRVNAVLPGPVLLPENSSRGFRNAVIRATPLKRVGSPGDIAKAVLYLIESGDFITGAQIPVDGGRLIA